MRAGRSMYSARPLRSGVSLHASLVLCQQAFATPLSSISSLAHQKPAESEDIEARILDAMPLILAAIYYLLAPFFVGLARRGFIDSLTKADMEWKGPDNELPPHRTSEYLSTNIDWIIDAPQMVPSLLLPLAAVLFAFRNSFASAVILALSALGICVATLWIYFRSPLEYRSIGFLGHRYTLVTASGVILNTGAAILLILR